MGGGLPGLRLFFLDLSGKAYRLLSDDTQSSGIFNTVIRDPYTRGMMNLSVCNVSVCV